MPDSTRGLLPPCCLVLPICSLDKPNSARGSRLRTRTTQQRHDVASPPTREVEDGVNRTGSLAGPCCMSACTCYEGSYHWYKQPCQLINWQLSTRVVAPVDRRPSTAKQRSKRRNDGRMWLTSTLTSTPSSVLPLRKYTYELVRVILVLLVPVESTMARMARPLSNVVYQCRGVARAWQTLNDTSTTRRRRHAHNHTKGGFDPFEVDDEVDDEVKALTSTRRATVPP